MKRSRRIDHDRTHRSPWLAAVPALAWVLMNWPAWGAGETPEVEAGAPDSAVHPDRQRLETIIRQKYPQLATERIAGVPVVTVLLNHDGTLAATDLEISPKGPDELTVSKLRFARFGIQAKDLSYIGIEHVVLPPNTVLVMYGGKGTIDPDRAGGGGG